MSASDQNLQDFHLDGEEETDTVVEALTPSEADEEEEHFGDVSIENSEYAHGVQEMDIESIGSVQVPTSSLESTVAIEDSDVGTVRGDVAGKTVLKNSSVDVIEGDAKYGRHFARDSHNVSHFGDLTKVGTPRDYSNGAFKRSNLPTVVSSNIDIKKLDNESVGGLFLADDIDIDDSDGDMFVVTPQSSRNFRKDATFPARDMESTGFNWDDWKSFKQEVKERDDEIYGLPIFAPNGLAPHNDERMERTREIREEMQESGAGAERYGNDTRTFRNRFFANEQYFQEILSDELDADPEDSLDAIAARLGHLKEFTDEDNRMFASLINGMMKVTDDNVEELDRKYVEQVLSGEQEFYDISDLKSKWDDDSVWHQGFATLGGHLNDAVEQNDEIENLVYLAEFSGEHVDLDTEQWVVEQKERKQNGQDFEKDTLEGVQQRLEEEVEELRKEYAAKAIEQIGNAGSDADLIEVYDNLHPRVQGQIISKVAEDIPNEDDFKREQLREFGEILQHLDSDSRDFIYQALRTEKDEEVLEGFVGEHGDRTEYGSGDSKFGNTLFDIAVNRDYNFFVEDEEAEIQALTELEGSLPEADEFFEDDSPYKQIIDEVTGQEDTDIEYGEMSDEELAEKLRTVRGLADNLDLEYDASNVFGMLKSKEGRRQNTDFEPEPEDIESLKEDRRKELEKDVQSKLRGYLKQNLQKVGYNAALEEYEEATGERPEQLTENELAALKVRKEHEGHSDTVDTLLSHQNEVYQLEGNQQWLEEHGFDSEQIIDPDLSDQEDDTYRHDEDKGYRSALTVEIDSDNVEFDVDAEKQQYWTELNGILSDLGAGTVDSVEEAEQSLEEMNPEENDLYSEAKDVLNNYRAVENRSTGIPDELTLHVADPMDTTRMGRGFGSCHDVDGGSYAWASVSNAVDANKMVFYAEDEEGRERARVKAFITEDEEMVYHNTSQYKDVDIDTGEYFEDYMSKVSDSMGLELKHSDEVEDLEQNVELLEADNWYSME